MEMEPNSIYILHSVGDLQVLQLSRKSILPSKQAANPASYTLFTPYDYEVPAGRTISVSTDLCVSPTKPKH